MNLRTPLHRPPLARGRQHGRRRSGYTLVELLVVVLIVTLLSAAMIPVVLPAINASRIQSAASLVYGELTKAHDIAVRQNRASGVRLVPDPIDPTRPTIVTASRLIAIESGPDYSEGQVGRHFQGLYVPPAGLPQLAGPLNPYLVVHEEKYENIAIGGGNVITIPRSPTSWFYNLRQGDKLRLNDSGHVYTIAGPITNPNIAYRPNGSVADPANNPAPNAERLINFGPPAIYPPSLPGNTQFEFLFLTNGQDDDDDGYIDEGFDGIDNDGDGVIDPGFNGLDDDGDGSIDEPDELFYHRNSDGSASYFDPSMGNQLPNEYEKERFVRSPAGNTVSDYTVSRRPVVSPGAREVTLPENTFIDLTSWNLTRERSRVPIDPYSGVTDILIAPNGQLVAREANANPAPPQNLAFYHLWLAEGDDLYEPTAPLNASSGQLNLLPMPREALYLNANLYPPTAPSLKGARRLVSINARTGQISTNTLEQFDPADLELPYRNAQMGIKEQP